MKKANVTRIALASIIALLSASTSLITSSCSGEAKQSETAPAGIESQTQTETAAVNPYDPKLPELDYEGYTVRFAGRGNEGANEAWDTVDIVSEEQNGEVLNDAVYERNRYVSELLNVNFSMSFLGDTSFSNGSSAVFKAVAATVMAGEDAYDVVIAPPYDTTGFAGNGYSTDLSTIENLDLTRDWWDQNAISQLTFNGKIYFTTGEITYVDNKATQIMLFIKDIVKDYGLDDPYELVRNGVWTTDKLIEMSSQMVSDLNGDSIINENDMLGYIYWQDGCHGLLHAAGITFGGIGTDGKLALTLYSDKSVGYWEKLINFASGESAWSILNDQDVLKGQNADSIIRYMIENEHTLFSFAYVNHVLLLRQIETDFGIIPNPKYDESQESYYATAHGWGTPFVNVPITSSDLARTGAVLEAMAAKSAEIVTPAFYEKTLTGKSIRDDDSAEMLDLIFAGKVYDMGYYFAWGGLTEQVMKMWNNLDPNLTSMYEKYREKAESGLAATAELFDMLTEEN